MKTREMILCALFAALTAIGGFLKIPFPSAAITLQFFFTAMAGVLLGAKYGALSQGIYVLLGLAGVPVFAMGGGVSYVLQPTFGYVLGLTPAAWLIGRLRKQPLRFARTLGAMAAGLAADYACGLSHLTLISNVYLGQGRTARELLLGGAALYLPGDLCKIVLAALLSLGVARRLPRRP